MASRRHASQRSAWAGAAAIAAACLFTLSTLPAAAQSPTDLSQTDLARAYQTIASKTFVDLTHSFGPDTPAWSGFGQAKFSPAADPKTHEPYTIAKDGFRTTYYEMVGQYGTHVDPPAHFAENGITMDKMPLKQMILPLVVLDDTPYLQSRLFDRRPQGLGAAAWARSERRLRCVTHRHVQGLGRRSRALQAQPVSGLGARNDQISLRGTRRDGDRSRKHGYRHDRQNGFRDVHSSARPLSDRGDGEPRQSAPDWCADPDELAQGAGWSRISSACFCDIALRIAEQHRRPARYCPSRPSAIRAEHDLFGKTGFHFSGSCSKPRSAGSSPRPRSPAPLRSC